MRYFQNATLITNNNMCYDLLFLSSQARFKPTPPTVTQNLKQGYQKPIYYLIYGQYLKIPNRVYGTATLITAISLNHINGLPAPNI